MDRILSRELYDAVEYSVLGEGLQTLQVLLKPGQKILVDEESVVGRTGELIKDTSGSARIYTNVQYELGYVLLNKNGGKIIALDLNDLASMYFDEASILAHTPNAMASKEKIMLYKKKLTRAIPAKSNRSNFNPKFGYVFLQLDKFDALIEKTLEEEPLIVKTSRIVAISDSLISTSKQDKDCILPSTIKLTGQGKVYLKTYSVAIMCEPEDVVVW